MSCKHQLKYVSLTNEYYSNVNPDNIDKDWIEHYLDVFPEVSCADSSMNDNVVNGVTTQDITRNIPSCMYFYEASSKNYNCLRCPFG